MFFVVYSVLHAGIPSYYHDCRSVALCVNLVKETEPLQPGLEPLT